MTEQQTGQPNAVAVAPLAVIMAAGRGTRMGGDLPKVLFEATGKPLVRWVLDSLASAGIADRIVVVGYRAALVEETLAGLPGVSFALQKEQRGTGDAVAAAAALIKERLRQASPDARQPVVIVCGDSPMLRPESVTGLIDNYFSYVSRIERGLEAELVSPNDIRALNSDDVSAVYASVFRCLRARAFGGLPALSNRQAVNALTHLLLAELHWFNAWRFKIHSAYYGRFGRRVGEVLMNGIVKPSRHPGPLPFPQPLPVIEASEGSAKDAFLQAATELINEQGYHGASVERISARLSVSKGSFYHHVETKDDLITACFDRTIGIIQSTIAEAEARSSNALEALLLLAVTLVHRQLSGEATLLRLSAGTTLPESLQPNVYMEYNRIAVRIGSMFSDGVVDGSIRPLDSYVAAEVFLGMVNTSDELSYFVKDMNFDIALKSYIEPLFLGIRSYQSQMG